MNHRTSAGTDKLYSAEHIYRASELSHLIYYVRQTQETLKVILLFGPRNEVTKNKWF
jgi:hypothetical protein